MPRRSLGLAAALALVPAAAHAAKGGETADSSSDAPDVAVFCDATLEPALRDAARRFGRAPVHLFSTSPPSMLELIARQTQTDILISGPSWIDQGVSRKLLQQASRTELGRARYVIASRAPQPAPPKADAAVLDRLLANGTMAITDPTPAASFDGAAMLDRLGLGSVAAGRRLGAANVQDVAFLVANGGARLGLMYATDVMADRWLAVAATLPESPAIFVAALATQPRTPNARAFLEYLRTPDAVSRLRTFGLEDAA